MSTSTTTTAYGWLSRYFQGSYMSGTHPGYSQSFYASAVIIDLKSGEILYKWVEPDDSPYYPLPSELLAPIQAASQ